MKNKIKFKEKGITLISLVITIIILLILAGVTLNTALGQNGLFKIAKESEEKYKESEKQEGIALENIAQEMDKISIDYNDYVGVYVEGYEPSNKDENNPCIIEKSSSGADVDQKFTTEEIKWKIFDYDKTTKIIRLISNDTTQQKLKLEGVEGYNNGIWAINEVCRQCYGTGERGVTVANLKRSDIQKVSNYDYTNYKHIEDGWEENDEGTIYFGAKKEYVTSTKSFKYPKMWEQYDSKWTYDNDENIEKDKECLIWEKENGYINENSIIEETEEPIFIKQSYYWHNFLNEENNFIKEQYYEIFFKDDNKEYLKNAYWISSRNVHLYGTYCGFGVGNVDTVSDGCPIVGGNLLYHSNRWK